MGKLISQMMISVDGYVEGPNRELDWHVWSEEMEQAAARLLASVDYILLGRVTYELFVGYWPTSKDSIAPALNDLQKVIFSRTLRSVNWSNASLAEGEPASMIRALKERSRKDLVIFGSPTLVSSLVESGVIDEYQVIVNPVAIGAGRPYFQGLSRRLHLSLERVHQFDCGNVLLTYRPKT